MSELKLKDLKNMLTDNELDLSTQQITTIPVKALSLLPRATCIDFSNNSITKISPEFCQLIHLTKLDFTKNKIIQLPDDFGKLINLTYLDLYKNRIKDLPLSFGNLLNLKWLDLKGNPLESELEKFANECEDEKGYKRTAVRVVQLMQKRAIVQHEMVNNQNEFRKHITNDIDENVDSNQKTKPKKKKKKKTKEILACLPNVNVTEQLLTSEEEDVHDNNMNMNVQIPNCVKTISSFSFIWAICRKFFICAIIFWLVGTGLISYLIFENCKHDIQWIPSSKPFCDSFVQLTNKHKLDSNFFTNLYGTVFSLLRFFLIFAYDCAQSTFSFVSENSFFLYKMGQKWYMDNNISIFVNALIQNAVIFFKVFFLMFADLAVFLLEVGLSLIEWLTKLIMYYAEHNDEIIEKMWNLWKMI